MRTNKCSLLFLRQFFKVAHVVFASASSLRTYAESFLGRPINDEKELEDMCITIFSLGFTAVQMGYKNKVFIGPGVPQEDGSFNFSFNLIQTPGVRAHNYADTIIYSKPHYNLFARCVEGTMRDWKVANTGTLTDEDKKTILNKIEAAGFRRDLAKDLTSFCDTNRILSRKEMAQQVLDAFKNQNVSLNIRSKIPIPVGTKVYDIVEDAFQAEVRGN